MAGQIAEWRELLEAYRRRAECVPFRPVAAAYAEAADELEKRVAGLSSTENRVPQQQA